MTTPHTKILPLTLMAGLLACTSLTLGGCGLNREPPPRYNTVVGEKRAPVLNPQGQGLSGLPVASAPPYPVPPGPPPYPSPDGQPLENTVSVVPAPHTPQSMAGMEGAPVQAPAPAASAAPTPYDTYHQEQPQQEGSWYSGITDMFGSEDESAINQHAGLPRKAPPGNTQAMQEQDMRAAPPIGDVAASDMPPLEPAPMEAMTPIADIPADAVVAPAPAPVATDAQGYPVLAETPSAPVATDAKLEEARKKLQAMQDANAQSQATRSMQDSFDASMAPASQTPPMPNTSAMQQPPASGWQPIGEAAPVRSTPPAFVDGNVIDQQFSAPAPMPAPAPVPMTADTGWQPVVDMSAPPAPQPAAPAPMAMTPPPPAPSEPVQVMQDVQAASVVPEQQSSLAPIALIPPPAVAATPNAVRSNYSYIAPSRYERRREVQALTPFRSQ